MTAPAPSSRRAREEWKPAEGNPLTPRQLDVLRRIAAGQSWQQIGNALGITIGGVGSLNKQILLKLGAATAAQAVDVAHRRRLMTERAGCGDRAAYMRHWRKKEPACWRCLAGNTAAEAERRASQNAA